MGSLHGLRHRLSNKTKKNSKYFAGLEKKKAESKIISRLNIKGNIITSQKSILAEEKKFYEHLYSKKEQTNSNIDFFDNALPKLNENESNSCEGQITEQECIKAIKEMKNQKSPGSDGITAEFYKIFWHDIKDYYLKSINFSFQNQELTELQKQSVITLLPKPGKDNILLENWRPISLLNVDYKIATKVIANRIKNVLPKLIHETQTGFMKGRYIGENIRLIFETIDYVDEQNLPGILFFSDYEKAFDSISHDFLFKCLRHFNFNNDLLNWIRLFYKDAKSCVSNNGHHSQFFTIRRGVRQGCPLSPYLFIICIELLSNQILKNQDVKGIHINGKEFKTSLFADDAAFIMDGSRKSFDTLVNIMDNFSNISGLKLNAKKCQILRIGVIKHTNIEFMKHRKFSWNSEEASCLGMIFKTNKQNVLSSNLEPKVKAFKTCLQQWSHRKLTLMGKIVVIKNFALPKLIYPLTSLQNPPKETVKQIEQLMYSFLWDNKPDKIKRSTLIKDYNQGGLRMIDIEKFIWSLKASWIKRFLQPENKSLLKTLYKYDFKKFGGNILFECYFNDIDVIKHFKNKPFLKDILIAWSNLNFKPIIYSHFNEILWNNSNIRVDDKTVFYKRWSELGIKYVKDIYDHEAKVYCPFRTIQNKFGLPSSDYLRYLSLINSIPKDWKRKLSQENSNIPVETKLLEQLKNTTRVNKFIYNCFLNKTLTHEIKSEIKWNEQFSNENLIWKNIYTVIFKTTNDIKLRNFQYKYLMRIIPTNQFLTKCHVVSSSLCEFCNMEIETFSHLFWECTYVQQFWTSLTDFLNRCNFNFSLDFKTMSFGITQANPNYKVLTQNFIIYIGKYFIFQAKQRKQIPNIQHFKSFLLTRIKIEKEIALLNDKLASFETKWRTLIDTLTTNEA